ncbi:MAG: TIGR02301 family protein, partial [Alphaproteobacteria bacterium]
MNLKLFSVLMVMVSAPAFFLNGTVAFAQDAQASKLDIAADPDARPYDAQIYRLSEILGAVHYLRALCGADENQVWRKQMHKLVNAEGTNALRRAKLVASFNKGYRGYARTYRTCTKPALLAIKNFMEQGGSIAYTLVN